MKTLEELADELNTTQHLVQVYKIQAKATQARLAESNKELVDALMLAVFYLQDTTHDLSKLEDLIKKYKYNR